MKRFYIILVILLGFAGCKTQSNSESEATPQKELNSIYEPVEIGFYEVYQLPDQDPVQFLRNVVSVDDFIPRFNLDTENYPKNVLGITVDEKNKIQILKELLLTDSLTLNSKLIWSKRKQFNLSRNEEAYHLYMLKKDSKYISNADIKSAKATKNPMAEDYMVELTFNTLGTKKWSLMTKKAADDNNSYIAIVANDEVYFCAYVVSQLDFPEFPLYDFESLEEAHKMAKGIMKKVDSK